MYIAISSAIAGIPYLVVPALTPPQVFFSVAIAALIGMIIVFLIRNYAKKVTRATLLFPTVEMGGKSLVSSSLYKLEDLPNVSEILKHAKHSAHFAGGNLDGLVNQYAPKIEEYAGKVRMGFLFVDPESSIGQAMESDADPVKSIRGQTRRAIQTLLKIRDQTLPQNRRDEFDIRAHKRLPFNMILVDIEDRDSAVIQIGYYAPSSPASHRPCALVSPKSEIYDILLREFNRKWERGMGDRPLRYV